MPTIILSCDQCDFETTVHSCIEADRQSTRHQNKYRNSNPKHYVGRDVVSGNCYRYRISRFFANIFGQSQDLDIPD